MHFNLAISAYTLRQSLYILNKLTSMLFLEFSSLGSIELVLQMLILKTTKFWLLILYIILNLSECTKPYLQANCNRESINMFFLLLLKDHFISFYTITIQYKYEYKLMQTK